MSLYDYGWNKDIEATWRSADHGGLEPARVLGTGGGLCRLMTEAGERPATTAGRLRREAATPGGPAVGDWVAARAAGGGALRIERILPRRTWLSRKQAGRRTGEQVAAANLDLVIVVMGLDADFNLRRLERILTLVAQSGAMPMVLLNKSDLFPDHAERARQAAASAAGAPVLVASSLTGDGVEAVRAAILPGRTGALIGSSGAGKSTLINKLLGEPAQVTQDVRPGDGRGRHTTTRREMFLLPGGGLLIDNPGIREVQLWAGEESLDRSFQDVATLAPGCRYRDCAHAGEPGCAVRDAAESGALPPGRLEAYRSLRAELRYLELKQDGAARREERRRWRSIHKALRKPKRGV
ncbi:MAG TPA: ribosome small subunit-dependent GTPase A [Candidatus Polarisedimenticolia bacterium]|nr:ribosome small subunit-dependent GTPase A [Candidatus Polarisedimenticolia bacterium]